MKVKKQFYIEETLEIIRKNKVITISELINSLHCSVRTAHTRLKEWGGLCSYNKNGKVHEIKLSQDFSNYLFALERIWDDFCKE